MNQAIAEGLEQVYALQRAGRVGEAESRLNGMLVAYPLEPALHRANALLAQHAGRQESAAQSMREAVRLAPNAPGLRLELGQVLAAQGDVDSACEAFEQAIALQPDLVDGWLLLGMTLYGARRDVLALPALRRAHQLAPDRVDVVRARAEAEIALEHYDEALPLFERLSAQWPLDLQLRLRLGRCYSRMGAPERALDLLRDALQGGSASAELWVALGQAQEELGDSAGATHAYEQAHALNPNWADPIGGLLMLHRAQAPATLVDTATSMLESGHLADAERAYLHYSLGKVMDSRADYPSAMSHWHEANRLRRNQIGPLDRAALRQRVDEAKLAFTPTLFARLGAMGSTDDRAVFVVGMPRSGTTLVEQILATHPQVHGAGELTELVRIASALPGEGFRWPLDAARMQSSTLQRFAAEYLAVAARQAEGDPLRIVDKQPYNFFHVGLAGLLFPRARVIWCRRDPRDVSLSIYSENFGSDALYATDFDDINCLIEAQEELMRHWQRVSPLPILEVDYESLVSEIDREARRIVGFAGLPWDDACLQFHLNPRAVQTPSRWQVRQPVHARSVGRWRNYAAHMPPSTGSDA